MPQSAQILSVDSLVSRISDGAIMTLPSNAAGVPMTATRAIIRAGIRDLHLVAVPVSGLQADMLIGAGAVRTIETAAVTMDEFGAAPRFTAAVSAGSVAIMDATCPAILAALQAAEKGLPFMALRGLLGTDLLAARSDWKVIDNPFARTPELADPIVLLPAIQPDVALFHAERADAQGNVWIGRRRELMTVAHAAKTTLVTVEEIIDDDLLANDQTAAGTIPALYVSAIAECRAGCWPLGFGDCYDTDEPHLRDYLRLAASEQGFADYLDRYVHKIGAAAQ